MGNLVKPVGKPKNRQSSQNKIFELATASPTNLILKILPIFRLLWIWYSVELRLKEDEVYSLRWFTPTTEVDMCGHATLASAYVLFECLGYEKDEIIFSTKSGELKVWKEERRYVMDFPIQAIEPCDISEQIVKALGVKPMATLKIIHEYF